MENKLKWFGTVLEWVQKYSIWSFIKAGLVFMFVCYVTFISLNPGIVYDKVVDYIEQTHSINQDKRAEATIKINYILKDLLVQTNADRAWVIEYHNGTSGLGGLPFIYGIMNAEVTDDNTYSVASHYKDFLLSEFPFILETSDYGGWIGDVEQIKKYDKKLYYSFKSNDVNHIAWFYLQSENSDIGVIGISYCDNRVPSTAWSLLRDAGIKVSIILNK